MGEFEELDTDEPLGPRMERHAFDRLIMLSDGVYAIAITLAALEVRPPDHWNGLGGLLDQLKFPLFAYVLSFVVIAAYWISQRELISRLRRVDRSFTWLVLVQLLFVALIPATTQLLYKQGPVSATVQLYAGILAACGFLTAAMWAYGSFKPGLMHPDNDTVYRWLRVAGAAVIPLIFVLIGLIGVLDLKTSLAPLVVLVLLRRIVFPYMLARRQRAGGPAR